MRLVEMAARPATQRASGFAGSQQMGVSVGDAATALRNRVFQSSRLRADRTQAWHVAYGADLGPIRVVHELGRLVLFEVDLPDGRTETFKNNEQSGWSIGVSWRITGEPYDSRLYRQRARPVGFPTRPLVGPGAGESLSQSKTDATG